MKTISVRTLRRYLMRVKGAKPVTILARTLPDYVGGKKCPVANVHKIAVVNAMINFDYAKGVNRRREKEALASGQESVEHFIPNPRQWGRRLHDSLNNRLKPLVVHTVVDKKAETKETRFYAELMPLRSLGYSYFDDQENKVPKEQVEPHIRQKKEGTRQDLDKPLILRDYTLSNIKAIRLQGELYVIQA